MEYEETNAAHAKQMQTRRSAVVTNDIFVSFLHCKRKAFLLAAGTTGRPTDIETVLVDLEHIYRRQALGAVDVLQVDQDRLDVRWSSRGTSSE